MVTATEDAPAQSTLDKATTENFPVAPGFLPQAWRDDLMAVYGYARLVDDIGDGDLASDGHDAAWLGLSAEQAGDRSALLDTLETELDRAFGCATGSGAALPHHPLLAALVPVIAQHRLRPEPFLGLLQANRQDQWTRRYDTYEQLLGYCELSANPVGRLVLSVTGISTPERVRASDAVCTGLQIIEHLQDVAEDLARGRIYLPRADLDRFSVSEADLAAPIANASVRTLIAFESERAERLLDAGRPLVGSVSGRLRLLLAGFVGGGRAALRAIRAARYDVLAGPPAAPKRLLLRETSAALRREG
ncbi:squalene synthase HpnC [Streptomyces oceani]|uniref:Squalene synthase n=1 Tax=Streptomyces oceani TaxID=1075402 RepID=A0A1E7KJ44_9ACTN|nr:squalene synthase HpnC [Streptomyces oceani]OEV03950.1 squalene synthase [Streptomyces oceani]